MAPGFTHPGSHQNFKIAKIHILAEVKARTVGSNPVRYFKQSNRAQRYDFPNTQPDNYSMQKIRSQKSKNLGLTIFSGSCQSNVSLI